MKIIACFTLSLSLLFAMTACGQAESIQTTELEESEAVNDESKQQVEDVNTVADIEFDFDTKAVTLNSGLKCQSTVLK